MTQRTVPQSTGEKFLPLDVETLRETARRLLAEDAEQPANEELLNLQFLLRDHIGQLVPEVATVALGLPCDDVHRTCAQACIGEAQMRLRLGAGDNDRVRRAVAVRLARSVKALCDHLDRMSGVSA
ncbi:DUF6415 family natural product biosynthesis protein [Streptomyces krungchingensis]